MKRIGITINENSYTPEAYAYKKYLMDNGYNVDLAPADMLDSSLDLHIYFMGSRPFWKKKGNWKEIHEYQSLSTPPYALAKNILKKNINRKPDARIFLNNIVDSNLGFSDNVPFIYRDMGIDLELYQSPSLNPSFDIVYCGSTTRPGLIEKFHELSRLGFSILVVGSIDEKSRKNLEKNNNIKCLGKVSRHELPEIYRDCSIGLNYTPDQYPYNIQTSTKTLEYLASGLHVFSNRYQWAEEFFLLYPKRVTWLDVDSNLKRDRINIENDSYCFKKFSWENVLNNSGIINLIDKLID